MASFADVKNNAEAAANIPSAGRGSPSGPSDEFDFSKMKEGIINTVW